MGFGASADSAASRLLKDEPSLARANSLAKPRRLSSLDN